MLKACECLGIAALISGRMVLLTDLQAAAVFLRVLAYVGWSEIVIQWF